MRMVNYIVWFFLEPFSLNAAVRSCSNVTATGEYFFSSVKWKIYLPISIVLQTNVTSPDVLNIKIYTMYMYMHALYI